MKPYWMPLLGLLVACAGGDAYTREGQERLFGRRGNVVWARGPWPAIQPSLDLDGEPPRFVVDERGRPSPVADYHSHPWAPSQMSSDDRRAELQLFSIRVQVDTACNVMKLIPYLNESRPGEAYLRRGRKWVLVGYIQNEDKRTGRITAVDDD